jgi:hypothetical protein
MGRMGERDDRDRAGAAVKKPRRHWYFLYWTFCPLGGHTEVERERRYTRRPKRWERRHELTEAVCYSCYYGSFG